MEAVTVVTMVVAMAVFTMAVVTIEAGGRIKHIKMETEHVSGMGTNGDVTSPLFFMATDS
jgi:hypothetical protein